MAEELGERTEEPTGKRRLEARRKGQVARSADLSAAILLTAAMVILYVAGPALLEGMGVLMRAALSPAHLAVIDGGDVVSDIIRSGETTARLLVPIMLIMAVVAFVEQIFQVGWFVSSQPLTPNFTKFNPISGAKKLLSLRSLVKGGVNILKFIVVTVVVTVV
ncbi:MAG: EscU/YscU/HrcU family type III secretion system export apparatus switch protein, partial [Planctomycetota bacterium]|nr:EscU/YscU/HrcU family type III secretion system export apparatus switch protein [Planctomycetota bacterium]